MADPPMDSAISLSATVSVDGDATPAPLPSYQRVGRYLILERIGKGGMGAVYAAYDPDLDRKVAIKLLRQRDHSAERRDRLLAEARTMARIPHPHIVAVHDVGVVDEHLFVAMELVEGETLKSWLI